MSSTSPSLLDVVDLTFQELAAQDPSLAIDGRLVHEGLPQREIGVFELRSVLLHPSTSYAARDAVFRVVVEKAADPDWQVILVGLLLPGLRRVGGRLARGECGSLNPDIDSELVAGVLEGLKTDLGQTRMASGLINHAIRRARSVVRTEERARRISERVSEAPVETQGPHVALEDLRLAGVINEEEADLIALTRLEGRRVSDVAAELGTAADTLRHRRRRAETRIANYLKGGRP